MYTHPYPVMGLGDFHNPGTPVMGLGDYHNPGIPVMGLGAAQGGQGGQNGQGQGQLKPVIDGVGGWGHVGLGAVAGIAVGWFLWNK